MGRAVTTAHCLEKFLPAVYPYAVGPPLVLGVWPVGRVEPPL